MSAYYDLLEKPDIRRTGEQQPLYARFVAKGTIDRKEFIDRVHLFTGISRSVLEGAMAAFMDELRDCLANGWTVELGELGYFTPSLSCRRRAMEKDEVRAASVALRGLNFRLGKKFHEDLSGKMRLERRPQPAVPLSSDNLSSMERRFQLLDEYLQRNPCAGHFADECAVRGVPCVFTRPALRRTALYADDAAGLRVLYPAARCVWRTGARLLHVL